MRKKYVFSPFSRLLPLVLVLSMLLTSGIFGIAAFATSTSVPIDGKVYEFDKDNDYKFSDSTQYSDSGSAYSSGKFSISSTADEIKISGKKNGVPSYSISDGTISVFYEWNDKILTASDTEWHIISDKEKNVDILKLDDNIQKGALILQRSIDHLNWSNVSVQTNVCDGTPEQSNSLYETLDVELLNGCYYRLIVAYEISRKVDSSAILWVIPHDEYEYKRVAEVYEFYAATENEHIEELQNNTKRYRLGRAVRVDDFASYSGSEDITRNDIHYNWKLGDFFVSGFTSASDSTGDIVFLKNVGDVITLWFNLNQNIDSLNNDSKLSITADPDGCDQYFQTPTTDFGRGMLIIRYTDYENVIHDPVMYYNFLEANTSLGANTRVQLFEEGDYEVALDYEVTKDQAVDKVGHYRIFFKFSVRNANCMVYPFDVGTGRELTNTSVTPNGFYLDLARSRYLDIFIKKETWTEGADGLSEDTRFNTTAKDGDKYTDEGIYTITVKNKYTGLETTKKIYVGSNRILLAYMGSNYSISELLELDRQGRIFEDGTIQQLPNTYAIKYKFISGTPGKELPETMTSMLPANQSSENGLEVMPPILEETEIKLPDGVWKFQGWDEETKTISGAEIEFVGTWIFEESPVTSNDSEPTAETAPISDFQQDDGPASKDESSTEAETVLSESSVEEENTTRHLSIPLIIGAILLSIVIITAQVIFLRLRKNNGKKEGL